ncbi:MAG: ABC transporter ATP-binding protein [Candidatus Hydrothermales bacterium]
MKDEVILKAEEISAGYGKREVLFDVNLEIKKGNFTLLIGPNGSGKSTLIKVMAGLLKPFKGKVFFKTREITHLSPIKRINMGIGYLTQVKNIFPILSVKENLELSGFELPEKEIKDGIEKVLNYFPFLKEKLNLRAGLLSGGERQALGISMILMKRKDILLLDEPTAGLAPSTASTILESITKIKNESNITILVVEHNLKLLKERVDEVIVMKNGKVVVKEKRELLDDAHRIRKLFLE